MDTIADLLVRLNSALKVRKELVDLPHSKLKEEIARILMAEGYIGKYEAMTRLKKKFLRLRLKYNGDDQSVIRGLRRVSTPGRRIYVGAGKIPRVRAGFGTVIVSTPRGLLTGEEARESKVGGELICYVW